MRRVAVLSTGRHDWGILRSTCAALRQQRDFELRLMLGGMHCSPLYGATRQFVEQDGFEVSEYMDWVVEAARPEREAAGAIIRVASALARHSPDLLLLAGDRFETLSAALAATLQRLPIAHLHGGEETEGAIDNALRHAITKLSHLHLVSHPSHAARVLQMGEEPGSVHVVGAPGLDNAHRKDLPTRAEAEQLLGISLAPPVVLVTLHPTTLAEDPVGAAQAVRTAMDEVPATYVVTLPNSDPESDAVRAVMSAAGRGGRRKLVAALGDQLYWGLLRVVDAMLGNSSSGLVEAPLLRLPVVNVGDRQRGRLRGANVIDVASEPAAVAEALRKALKPEFRHGLAASSSPYGDGHSAARIVDRLRDWRPSRPVRKVFVEKSV